MSHIQTVRGPIGRAELGLTLTHEHILCDFGGADVTHPGRWDRDGVRAAVLPLLQAARRRGVSAFVDCTPEWLGRDVELLRMLSEQAEIHILTNTGWYGAAGDRFLPPQAFTETPGQLADRWTREATGGIDGTDVLPGFIKVGVDPGQLSDVDRKLVRAAAITHKRTGLLIMCHTADGTAAAEILETLGAEDVPASAYVFTHADAEPDRISHEQVAEAGAWVAYDGIGWRPMDLHEDLVTWMLGRHPSRLLLSQDSGWWYAEVPGGGEVRPYTTMIDELFPRLREAGVSEESLHAVTVENPARAFSIA